MSATRADRRLYLPDAERAPMYLNRYFGKKKHAKYIIHGKIELRHTEKLHPLVLTVTQSE